MASTVKEACEKAGVTSYATARKRIQRGMDPLLAVTTPTRPAKNIQWDDPEEVKTYKRLQKRAWRERQKELNK